eukprot:144853-Pelagomonas_calceolata.AAC.1
MAALFVTLACKADVATLWLQAWAVGGLVAWQLNLGYAIVTAVHRARALDDDTIETVHTGPMFLVDSYACAALSGRPSPSCPG